MSKRNPAAAKRHKAPVPARDQSHDDQLRLFLVGDVQFYNTLVWHFQSLADRESQLITDRIARSDFADASDHRRMETLAEALEDEDDGWKRWVEIEGREGTGRFKRMILDWLNYRMG